MDIIFSKKFLMKTIYPMEMHPRALGRENPNFNNAHYEYVTVKNFNAKLAISNSALYWMVKPLPAETNQYLLGRMSLPQMKRKWSSKK